MEPIWDGSSEFVALECSETYKEISLDEAVGVKKMTWIDQLHTCALCSELPYNIGTMHSTTLPSISSLLDKCM